MDECGLQDDVHVLIKSEPCFRCLYMENGYPLRHETGLHRFLHPRRPPLDLRVRVLPAVFEYEFGVDPTELCAWTETHPNLYTSGKSYTVHLTHKPSGITVSMFGISEALAHGYAMDYLRALLYAQTQIVLHHPNLHIRTYDPITQTVTDHRSGFVHPDLNAVLCGDLQPILDSLEG